MIDKCLLSLAQSTMKDFKIIVVDNGSSDDSLSLLKEAHTDVEFLPLNNNKGFAVGNNIGIRYALKHHKPEFVLLLNNDTIVEESMLARLVSELQKDDNYACVVPKIYYFNQPKRIYYAGGKMRYWLGVGKHYGWKKKDSKKYSRKRDITFANGCCMLLRTFALDQVGLFDEEFFAVSEDLDLSYRILKHNFKMKYVPDAIIWHKQSYSSSKNKGRWFVFYLGARNTILFQRKHKSYPIFVLCVIYFLFRWVLYNSIVLFYHREYASVKKIWQGVHDGLRRTIRFVI